jgi:hypothetical protein
MTGPNGASGKFDKLLRSAMRKDDDARRVLKRLDPAIAEKIEALDAVFSAILAKLERIEASEEALRMSPSRIVAPSHELFGDQVLEMMRGMSPDQRGALMNKLKQ